MTDDELNQMQIEREAINEWIDSKPNESQDRLRAFNWNLQQRVDKFDKPEDQLNELLTIFAEQATKLDDALSGIPSEQQRNNVVSFPSTVDPNAEK